MKWFSKKKAKPGKVMVVGLDGVPCFLLKKFIAEGVTPNIARITKGKAPTRMQVVYPEISSVSWPSFMTGEDPGGHGVFGFTDFRPNSYDVFFPGYADVQAKTIWEKLGEQGKRSIVINQPSTYPARKLEGALISGFVAVELIKSVTPSKYLGALKRMKYETDIDLENARKNADVLFAQLDQTLKTREAAYELLREREEWDYFEVVVTGTDRLQHYQMHAVLDPLQENHERAIDYYRKVDAFVGKMFDNYCADTGTDGENFIMLSDHGFTQIKKEVYVNSWLEENGYLSFSGDGRQIKDIDPQSRAFALDPGRIYLHRKGRFPNGCVNDEQAPVLLKEISDKLKTLQHEGEPIIQDIFTPEQVYHGPYVKQAADLIAWSHWGYDLKAATSQGEVVRDTDLTGMHTQDDAFLIAGDAFEDGVHITKLAEWILGKY